MSNYNIKLEGTEKVIENLNRLSQGIRSQAALDAVEAGAQIIRDKAVMNAPVLTGALRKSANVSAHNTAKGAEAIISFRGLAYARIQEFGGLAGRNHTAKITGKHYLGDAIESEKGLAVKAMADAVEQYLR